MHLTRKIHRKFLVFFLAPSDSFPSGKIGKSEMEDTVFTFDTPFRRGWRTWRRYMLFSVESDVFFAFHLNKRKMCDIIPLKLKNRRAAFV